MWHNKLEQKINEEMIWGAKKLREYEIKELKVKQVILRTGCGNYLFLKSIFDITTGEEVIEDQLWPPEIVEDLF
ncbi:hypothetical protein [Thermicanus aegyptius]|uniref:hypothetical protein n=1 Tax=Thermicanus aegyptius TaxID=94009 RepID=UPI000413BD9F|nr:hypothetical protein [Thermicanus aegyptius]